MNDPAYTALVSPYGLNKEESYPLPSLGFTSYGENEDEPADVVSYRDGLIGSLRKRYTFRNPSAVRGFLEEYPFLIQLLFRAHKEIRRVFRGGSLALEVVADPEAQEERELFLFIQTELHPRAARALLGELEREWWLDAILDARGEMNISLEYARSERV